MDIAARGIDVGDISHIVNYDLPVETESYVHHIGHTGRAGAQGATLIFLRGGPSAISYEVLRGCEEPLPFGEGKNCYGCGSRIGHE